VVLLLLLLHACQCVWWWWWVRDRGRTDGWMDAFYVGDGGWHVLMRMAKQSKAEQSRAEEEEAAAAAAAAATAMRSPVAVSDLAR
jgi:hypothetical protein